MNMEFSKNENGTTWQRLFQPVTMNKDKATADKQSFNWKNVKGKVAMANQSMYSKATT